MRRALDSLGPDGSAERARLEQLGARLAGFGYDLLADQGMAVFGTPDQAVQRIGHLAADLGADRVICWFDPGGLIPHADVVASMRDVADAAGLHRPRPSVHHDHARRPLDRPGSPTGRRP